MLAHGTLPEKDEGPQRFLETFVPDEVVKTSRKMSDETNERVGGGVCGGSTTKASARTWKSSRDNECKTDDQSCVVKVEYTDCKNLNPRKKSVIKENNQTT